MFQVAFQRLCVVLSAAAICHGLAPENPIRAQERPSAVTKPAPASLDAVPTKGAPQPATPAPLTPQRQAWVDEKTRIVAEIAVQRAQIARAVLPLIQRVLAKDREMFGTNHEQTAGTLGLASDIYFEAREFDLSVSARGEIWQIKKELYGE